MKKEPLYLGARAAQGSDDKTSQVGTWAEWEQWQKENGLGDDEEDS